MLKGMTPKQWAVWYWRYHVLDAARRYGRAWRYARHRLTDDDAGMMIVELENITGWHPLVTITAEDVLERARETYAPHPKLEEYAADAASYVGNKWSSSGDELWAAIDWALEHMREYAEQDGEPLRDIDEIEPGEEAETETEEVEG